MHARDWDANASFNSTNPISEIFNPARFSAFLVAETGPIPIYAGSTPDTAMEIIRALGFRFNLFISSSLTTSKAAAPIIDAGRISCCDRAVFFESRFQCSQFFH